MDEDENGECQFCRIVAGDENASVVTETEETVSFADVRPAAEGHTLVVPREHAPGLDALDPDLGGRVFKEGMELATAVRETLDPDGINFFLADGDAAGQEVGHAHLHVVPRWEQDDIEFGTGRERADREKLDSLAEQLRDHC